jgi:signal peptidase I
MKKTVVNIIKIFGFIVLSVFLIMVVTQRLNPKGNFFGFKMFVIVSESMKPSLNIGDVILTIEKEPEDIKVKDVITYTGNTGNVKDKIITHQVVNIQTEKNDITNKTRYIFWTQGTNNSVIDSYSVYEEQVHGVLVYRFRLISLISRVIRTTIGLIIFVVLPLSLLLIFEIMDIRRELKERRK